MKIAMFAGHGGNDPGACAQGLRESDYTLAVSNKATQLLRNAGHIVVNNRTTDIYSGINEKAAYANNQKVDCVVEVHLNSGGGTGTEVYCSVVGGQGTTMATCIVNRIAALGYTNRGVKTRRGENGDYFGIIRLTIAPAVLVETAFIDNVSDMQKYSVDDMALAIAYGLLESFAENTVNLTNSAEAIKKEKVIEIQKWLNKEYTFSLHKDGLYGPKTKYSLIWGLQYELVKKSIDKYNIDGIFGPKTKASVINLTKGDEGNLVYILQSALFFNGYDPIGFDGIFGDRTDSALRAFLKDKGMTVDGIAGKNTFEKLLV